MSTQLTDLPANVNPNSPLSEPQGGTGFSNPLGYTIQLGGPLITTGPVNISGDSVSEALAIQPVVTPVANCSGTIASASMIDSVSNTAGSKFNLSCEIALTATAMTGVVFDISVPYMDNNFSLSTDSNGLGVVLGGAGWLVSQNAEAGTQNVRFAFDFTSAAAYNLKLNFSYIKY